MPSAAYELIKLAIKNKQTIVATFGGHHRKMCPHAIGHRHGVERVFSYQFGGTSNSGLPPGGEWRCMDISRLSNISVHDGRWHTGKSHTRPQTCISVVDLKVDY